MATFTTDSYFDDTARTAGEAFTINGCKLTIRTDTRWHANAPASMVGGIGSATISSSLGGTLEIDATKVRWMAFDSGSGNVPAIGTTISQGGVSGYLLGVWASYNSAPSAVGGAMPASGFLKFREVTGGAFSAGALTGISANASSPDVTGWVEVIGDYATSTLSYKITLNKLGNFITNGDWFYLGTTNGTAHQTMDIPTNGGGTTHVPGVQIETAPGSGVYEWYAGALTSDQFTTARTATDKRGRYVQSTGSGIRIGGDGTNLIGYLPASGCKVRVPNIFLRTVSSASRATNYTPNNNSQNYRVFFAKNTFSIQLNNVLGDWDFSNFDSTTTAVLKYSALETSQARFTNIVSLLDVESAMVTTYYSPSSSVQAVVQFVNITSSATVNNFTYFGIENTLMSNRFGVYNCSGITFNNLENFNANYQAANGFSGCELSRCSGMTINGLNHLGSFCNISACVDTNINNLDMCFKVVGTTNSTVGAKFGAVLNNCANFKLDGISIGLNGQVADIQPYNGILQIDGTAGKVTVRNLGSRTNFVSAGSNATYYPQYIVQVNSGSSNLSVQRMYLDNVRTAAISFNTASGISNSKFEHIYTNYSKTMQIQGQNCVLRAIGSGNVQTPIAANFGTHWIDHFTSDTTGIVEWTGIKPSNLTSGENYIVTPGNTSFYTSADSKVVLNTADDYFYSEMLYFVKGHTGFANTAPILNGTTTANINVEYQLDSGSGWNGTWKTLNAANLSAESISPSGFKLKIRGTKTGTGQSDLASINIATTSTVQAQTDNLYVLDTVTLSFEGLKPGSEVRAYVGTDPATAVEIGGVESIGGTTWSFQHSSSGQDGYIAVFAMGYNPLFIPRTYAFSDATLLISQVVDRNYNNPV